MRSFFAPIASVWRDAVIRYWYDNGARRAAALSFYMLFSLPALLVIITSIVGITAETTTVETVLTDRLNAIMSAQAAREVSSIAAQSLTPSFENILIGLVNLGVLVVSALWAFLEVQTSLNEIWDIPTAPNEEGLRAWVTHFGRQLAGFTVTVGAALLLMAFFVTSTSLYYSLLPSSQILATLLDTTLSVLAVTILLGVLFHTAPNRLVPWRAALIGAVVTGLLFAPAKTLISLFLQTSALQSTYGAASSLVVLLIWIYYLSAIFYMGAEFTGVLMRREEMRSSGS